MARGWFALERAESGTQSAAASGAVPNRLTPPSRGSIPVAFVISDGAVIIDFCGPWEVFENVMIPSRGMGMDDQMPFQLYTVSDKTDAIHASGGMKIAPDYTFDNAPQPKVIVIPAQEEPSDKMIRWIREASQHTDVTMSVCTGAFILAKTGLLNGKAATTHHSGYIQLAMQYPDIQVKRGYRFVDDGNIASAGGLTSGMDLAMHVVERYFGRDAAVETAYLLEYQGQGWLDFTGAANAAYAKARQTQELTCIICGMSVDKDMSPSSVYKGKTYYFCSQSHKELFDSNPEKVVKLAGLE
jgi:putative intracellular protease/amidase/YHS domain-containing protein